MRVKDSYQTSSKKIAVFIRHTNSMDVTLHKRTKITSEWL